MQSYLFIYLFLILEGQSNKPFSFLLEIEIMLLSFGWKEVYRLDFDVSLIAKQSHGCSSQ